MCCIIGSRRRLLAVCEGEEGRVVFPQRRSNRQCEIRKKSGQQRCDGRKGDGQRGRDM